MVCIFVLQACSEKSSKKNENSVSKDSERVSQELAEVKNQNTELQTQLDRLQAENNELLKQGEELHSSIDMEWVSALLMELDQGFTHFANLDEGEIQCGEWEAFIKKLEQQGAEIERTLSDLEIELSSTKSQSDWRKTFTNQKEYLRGLRSHVDDAKTYMLVMSISLCSLSVYDLKEDFETIKENIASSIVEIKNFNFAVGGDRLHQSKLYKGKLESFYSRLVALNAYLDGAFIDTEASSDRDYLILQSGTGFRRKDLITEFPDGGFKVLGRYDQAVKQLLSTLETWIDDIDEKVNQNQAISIDQYRSTILPVIATLTELINLEFYILSMADDIEEISMEDIELNVEEREYKNVKKEALLLRLSQSGFYEKVDMRKEEDLALQLTRLNIENQVYQHAKYLAHQCKGNILIEEKMADVMIAMRPILANIKSEMNHNFQKKLELLIVFDLSTSMKPALDAWINDFYIFTALFDSIHEAGGQSKIAVMSFGEKSSQTMIHQEFTIESQEVLKSLQNIKDLPDNEKSKSRMTISALNDAFTKLSWSFSDRSIAKKVILITDGFSAELRDSKKYRKAIQDFGNSRKAAARDISVYPIVFP